MGYIRSFRREGNKKYISKTSVHGYPKILQKYKQPMKLCKTVIIHNKHTNIHNATLHLHYTIFDTLFLLMTTVRFCYDNED